MKKQSLIFPILIVILVSFAINFSAYAGSKLIKSSLCVDGKEVKVETIRPKGQVHVELNPLARALDWKVVDQSASLIYINNRPFKYFVKYNNKIFANAYALGKIMGYEVEVKEDGDLINFLTPSGKSKKGINSIRIEVKSREKSPTQLRGHELYKLKVEFKNMTSVPMIVRTARLLLIDNKGKIHACENNDSISLKPGESKTVDRIYFTIPKKCDLEYIALANKAGKKLLGRSRW